jgi:ribosomal protein L11 methyltransferase
VSVAQSRAEQARARMIELFPEGFEEIERDGDIELAAYTDASGEERMWAAFGAASATQVEEGWAERWRAFHRPVVVAGLWIGPPWERAPAGATAVVIEPAQAFGTGAHPTTRLCLQLLASVRGGSAADLGCGSGVLAIAAAKLGFYPVFAFDHDPRAVEATEQNAAANGVDVVVRNADVLTDALPTVDVALANITLDAVREIGARVDSGHIVTSGYVSAEEPILPGFRRVERRTAEGWAADLHARQTE